MRTQEEIISKLREHQSPSPSQWREKAEWRMKNREWLRYSQRIAMIMLDHMEAQKMSQKQLAERMGCSQQYVSKILKGQENLSLETITKIQQTLGIQILNLQMPYTIAEPETTCVAEEASKYGK